MTRIVALTLFLASCGFPVSGPLPLVVVLHGYGGTPKDVAHLVDGLEVHARILTPHGDTPTQSGFSWFSSPQKTSEAEFETGLRSATESLVQQIADAERTHPSCGKPIVVGFSQGGFLSYALAARSVPVVGLALPIAGYLPPSLRPTTKPKDAPTVIAFHGDNDPRVELAWDRTTHDAFTALGFAGSVKTYPGIGHAVSKEEMKDIRSEIAAYVKSEHCDR